MTRQILSFDQTSNAFIGLIGTRSLTSAKNIVKMGAVEFTCWSLDLPPRPNSFVDNLTDLYYENSNFLWIALGLTLFFLIIIIVCSCYLHKSLMMVEQLKHQKDIMVLDPEAAPNSGKESPSKARDADNTSGALNRKRSNGQKAMGNQEDDFVDEDFGDQMMDY